MNDLPNQKDPDDIAGDEDQSRVQEHIAAPDLNNLIQTKPFLDCDNFFKLIGAIGIASWTVQEWIIPHNKIFLFITILCFVADVFYLVFHKILPRNRLSIALGWAVYFACIWLVYKDSSGANPVETNSIGWLPPELQKGCSNVVVLVGEQALNIPISDAEIFENKKFKIHMGPPGIGFVIDCPIGAYVTNNRLFISAYLPFKNEGRIISMSDDLDAEIPYNWDRNYSSNAFEIVLPNGLPALQVFYKRPNEIQINGIFIFNTNLVYSVFGKSYDFMQLMFKDKSQSSQKIQLIVGNVMETYSVHSEKDLEEIYNLPHTEQKAIFKYPAWKHLGEFAN